jgi:hypothetical protein
MPWLPNDFIHPERVDLATGHHLRPFRESDVDIDNPAVMGSRTRLWSKYGDAWDGRRRTSPTRPSVDPARHEAEIAAHLTFNYTVLDEQETELLRCVYIDPPSEGSPEGARRGGLVVGSRPARWQPSRTRARRVRPALAGADMALPRCPLHPPDAEPDRCQATRRHRHWMRALPSIWNTAEEIRTNTDGVLCVLAISRSSMCTLLRGPTRPASRAGLEYRRQVKHRTTTPSK